MGAGRRVAPERRNFPGAPEFMRQHGFEVIDLDLPQCHEMFACRIAENPALSNGDIGVWYRR
jgi:cytosine deaminase